MPAAANLLGRAVALVEDERLRLELLPDYGEALLQVGRFEEAGVVLEEAIDKGGEASLPLVAAHASLVRLLVRLRAGHTQSWRDEAAVTIAEAMAVFQEREDHAGTAKAWRLLAWTHGTACHFALAAEAQENALKYARLADDARQQARAATAYAAAAVFGPTQVSEAIDRCELMLEQVRAQATVMPRGSCSLSSAACSAMQGSFDRAQELSAEGRAMLEDLGLGLEGALVDIEAWRVHMLADDRVAAEREIRRAYDALQGAGEKFILSTVAGLLAQTLYRMDRLDEVEALGRLAEELATDDDVDSQALWRCVRAKVLARQGAFDSAEAHMHEALEILGPPMRYS